MLIIGEEETFEQSSHFCFVISVYSFFFSPPLWSESFDQNIMFDFSYIQNMICEVKSLWDHRVLLFYACFMFKHSTLYHVFKGIEKEVRLKRRDFLFFLSFLLSTIISLVCCLYVLWECFWPAGHEETIWLLWFDTCD